MGRAKRNQESSESYTVTSVKAVKTAKVGRKKTIRQIEEPQMQVMSRS
jgi:hypothetical protein